MPTLDIFNDDAFSLVSMTDRINKSPYQPGLIGQLGIFPERGITTTSVAIEEQAGVLRLIQTNPRGAPPFVQPRDRRTLRTLRVPQLQKYDRIYADQVQNVRAFGSESEVETVQALADQLMAQMRAEIEVTIEHLRVSALQGIILDADGSTLYNLFTEFGVAQQTANITFSVATTDIRAQLVAVKRLVEAEMGGTPVTRFRAITSPEFFDALTGHARVQDAYRYQQGITLGQDVRDTFVFGDIMFQEYRGSIAGTPFVPASSAFVYPEAIGAGVTYFAPGDMISVVNTVGLPLYARTFRDDELDRHISLYVQSNVLPIFTRPRAVVRLGMN